MRSPFAFTFALLAFVLLGASAAHADEDCPPGSVHKTQDSFSWCEPTVCATDGQCSPNEVCRSVGLCMEVGTLADAATGDGGKRLVVTQRCAPDKTCPQKQTCSDLGRCLSKSAAEKMGILAATPAASTSSATAGSADTKKSACGCEVVGISSSTSPLAAVAVGLVVTALRRRRLVARRPRSGS